MNKIDQFINNRLKSIYGDSLERRDYYKLEKKRPDIFKGKGKSSGIMFLVDVDNSHYIGINLLEDNSVKFTFRRDETKLINFLTKDYTLEQIIEYLEAFILLINEYLTVDDRMCLLSRGIIQTDIKRSIVLNNILIN